MSILLISRTRSLTSQVSYLAGMIFKAGFAGRILLGDDPWLEEDVAEEGSLRVLEEDVTAAGTGGVVRFVDIGV